LSRIHPPLPCGPLFGNQHVEIDCLGHCLISGIIQSQSRKHPSIVGQAPSWGTKPTTFFRNILIPIEASDPLPATLLERFGESSFGCRVARSLT